MQETPRPGVDAAFPCLPELAQTCAFWQKVCPEAGQQGNTMEEESRGILQALKIALVDDEQECLETLAAFALEFGGRLGWQLETVPYREADSLLRGFRCGEYTAVFMDIFLESGPDGVSAARELRRRDPNCLVIFLTSSAAFMPDAFSLHAFDYVVKPIEADRICRVLTDVIATVRPEQPFIELRSGRQMMRAFHDEIVCAVSEGHYMNVRLHDGRRLRPRMTAKEFAALVSGDPRFLVMNKGIIVNADMIVDFEGCTCLLGDGERVPVRVRDRARIEQAARDYQFERIRGRQRRRRT